MKKYGFFGGAFNPPTIAHEELAKEVLEKFQLDKIYFTPVGNKYNKKDLIDEKYRYEMLKNISSEKIDVTDIELNKEKMTAAEAFKMIKKEYKNSEIYYIMGTDNLEKLPTWNKAEEMLANYKFIILPRKNTVDEIINKNKLLEKYKKNIYYIKKQLSYSSTDVRKAIQEQDKEVLEKMLKPEVYKYIKINKLYI